MLVIWKITSSFRPVGFFALWFAVNLAPTSSVIPLEDVITDRWLYLPSVGFAVIVAFAAEWISRAKIIMNTRAVKLIFFFLCALVIELYGFSTFLRNFTWTSSWTLWEDAAAKSPNKARPHINLGLSLTEAGFYEEGIKEFTRAIELNPRHGQAYLNLGYTYAMMGKIPEAINAYEKALVLSPYIRSEGRNNLGLAYLKQGRIEEGIKEFQKAIEARPNNANPYYNLGKYYAQNGEIDQAIFYLERAAQIEPEFFHIHMILSQVYEKKGWRDKSQDSYKNFLKYTPFGKYNSLKK
ncbi:MAG: tetratricopeptide repeat protein [Proteobacteria bacterium]|nr:tetratricopeptide repeat protein [Pseudomonadota bacterium]